MLPYHVSPPSLPCRALWNTLTSDYRCRCGAQFCYLCGLVWKTCDCRLWNEENLVHNAELNLGHGAEPNVVDQLPPLVQFDLVHNVLYRPGGAAAQNFQPNPQRPQCQHRNWRRVDGPHVCRGGCQFRLPNYIFACRNCGHLACRRCRRPNRRQQ